MTIAQNKAICFSLLELFIHFPFIYEKQNLPIYSSSTITFNTKSKFVIACTMYFTISKIMIHGMYYVCNIHMYNVDISTNLKISNRLH